MITLRKPCALALVLAALALPEGVNSVARADNPAFVSTLNFGNTCPLWDPTGTTTYVETLPNVLTTVSFTFSANQKGLLTGTGTFVQLIDDPTFGQIEINLSDPAVIGKIKSTSNFLTSGGNSSADVTTRIQWKSILTGSTMVPGFAALDTKAKIKFKGEIDQTGTAQGMVFFKVNIEGEKTVSEFPLAFDVTEDPTNLGAWDLSLDVNSPDGKNLGGTADLMLASGRMFSNLIGEGKYDAGDDKSTLKFIGGGGGKIKLKGLEADANTETLTDGRLKTRILGQKATRFLSDPCVSSLSTRNFQPRPISLGVSGSSIEPLIFGNFAACYAGTLGGLIKDDDSNEIYILSNNHVLAKENVPDLPPNTGTFLDTLLEEDGHMVIQPGLLDMGSASCATTGDVGDPDQVVGVTEHWIELQLGPNPVPSLPLTSVDAAIAAISGPQEVDVDGIILHTGSVSEVPAVPGVGMPVQKTGRTTGRTFGMIMAIDVDGIVEYDSDYARFENQLAIEGNCDDVFSMPGDSGSLILNVPNGSDRQVAGLLFAGSDTLTLANPIADVLSELAAEVGTSGMSPVECVDGGMGSNACNHENATDVVPACPAVAQADFEAGPAEGEGAGPPSAGPPFAQVDPARMRAAALAKAAHSSRLLSIPGVVGHGIGADDQGNPVILIYVTGPRDRPQGDIPSHLDGIPTRVVETSAFRAY